MAAKSASPELARLITAYPLSMTIREHDLAVLTEDLPEEGLEAGDVGTVVHVHDKGAAFEVEFMTLAGGTVAVVTVRGSQMRPVQPRDVAHAREMVSTGS